jgi:hypothetical protein
MSSRLTAGVVLFVGFGLTVQAAHADTVLGAETPQAVVTRMAKAAKTGDIGEMVACMEPESRAETTMAMLMGTAMMVAFMDMGSGMAGAMAEGMSEAGGEMKPEDKAKLAKQKAAAAAKANKAKASLSAILRKYGLPDLMDPNTPKPKEGSAKAMLAKVDQPALAGDLSHLMDELGDKDAKQQSTEKVPSPSDVKDYAVSGDHATAKAGAETLEFVRLGSRWFLKLQPLAHGK